MEKIYFTADTHFYHNAAIENGLRDFKSVEEMNQTMIDNWNAVIEPDDHVFHLGNFSYGTVEQSKEILEQLNGKKHLLCGNFDWNMAELGDYWDSIDHYLEIDVADKKIILCHYPMLVWNESPKGSWMLHGHCHGGVNLLNIDTTRHDVGMDNTDFKPLSADDLAKIFAQRHYESKEEKESKPLIYTV